MVDTGRQRFTFDAYDAEHLGDKALALCKAVRELAAGSVPKLIEKANDLSAYKVMQSAKATVREIEEFVQHTRKRRELETHARVRWDGCPMSQGKNYCRCEEYEITQMTEAARAAQADDYGRENYFDRAAHVRGVGRRLGP